MRNRSKGIVVIALLAIIGLTGCGKKTFNVSEGIEVNIDGYNGYGVCTLEDEYEWVEDVMEWYGDSITDKQRSKAEAELKDTVTYEISPDTNLSNGDTVTITVNIGSAAEEFAFNLKAEEITVTVEDLKEVKEFDPFENVTVLFEGIGPNGNAMIMNESNKDNISYELDKYNGLSNGDVVTLTAIPPVDMNDYAKHYGKVFATTEKKFTVEGLSSYATTINEITDDLKDEMRKQAEDTIKASCANWKEGNSLKETEFLGYYFLSKKEDMSVKPANEFYCVYKITANVTGLKRGGDGVTQESAEEVYYTYYKYYDVMSFPDGTSGVYLEGGEMPRNTIESDYGYWAFWGAEFFTYNGYKDLDSMFTEVVTKNAEKYTNESTVK